MTMQWYCLIDESTYGPFSSRQFQALAQKGKLRATDQVRCGDSANWVLASQVKGLHLPRFGVSL